VSGTQREIELRAWADIPLTEEGAIASSGLVSQTVTVSRGSAAACIVAGGTFGTSDPNLPRVLVSGIETGPDLRIKRKTLLNHRFSSPFGSGWAIEQVSRLYASADEAHLVHGDGAEE